MILAKAGIKIEIPKASKNMATIDIAVAKYTPLPKC